MSTVYHEGECFIQELMGVRQSSESLSSMIHKTPPPIAKEFLQNLRFAVITLGADVLHSAVVYGFESFIELVSDNELLIDLEKSTYLPAELLKHESLQVGFLGLEFESKRRIRVNGKGFVKKNKLHLYIDELYSNCPKFIHKRRMLSSVRFSEEPKRCKEESLSYEAQSIIKNANTFFLGTSHKTRGADVSHKGGERGFLRVLSPTELEFDDFAGNNMYNSLGNIHTNPYVSLLVIDFFDREVLHIQAKASIVETVVEGNKKLKVHLRCLEVSVESNSFALCFDS